MNGIKEMQNIICNSCANKINGRKCYILENTNKICDYCKHTSEALYKNGYRKVEDESKQMENKLNDYFNKIKIFEEEFKKNPLPHVLKYRTVYIIMREIINDRVFDYIKELYITDYDFKLDGLEFSVFVKMHDFYHDYYRPIEEVFLNIEDAKNQLKKLKENEDERN